MPFAIHFYDAITAGRSAAEGQIVRYDTLVCSEVAPHTWELNVALRDDVHVELEVAADSELAFLDLSSGLNECAWAKLAYEQFIQPEWLHVGLGSTVRVDPYIRFALYRNLLPYPCTGPGDAASFLDVETLARAVWLLRPSEYPWSAGPSPTKGTELHRFLMWETKLTGENRAMRVQSLLGELYRSCPKLVDHAIKQTSIRSLKGVLGLDQGEVSDLDSATPSFITHPAIHGRRDFVIGLPVAVDINYPDMLFVADLESDLGLLCDPATETYHDLVRQAPSDLSKPLVRVPLGRYPFCAPLSVIRREDAARLEVSVATVKANIAMLRRTPFLAARLREQPLLDLPAQSSDIYHRMWAGNFSATDCALMGKMHSSPPERWLEIASQATDGRFLELAVRLLHRVAPDVLSPKHRQECIAYAQSKISADSEAPLWLEETLKCGDDGDVASGPLVGLAHLHDRLTRNIG